MTTAIVFNPYQAAHDEPRHVERAARLAAIEAALESSGLLPAVALLEAGPISEQQALAVHSPRMLETLQLSQFQERMWIDGDTYTTPDSFTAAMHGAGAAVAAVEAVVGERVNNAFAMIRPPGHHATNTRSMGFCLLNNVAIAARYAIEALHVERVAIVDYDVHHGNGTQDIFYADPNVFFCSTHASPLYPGTGREHEIGSGAGVGTTLNVPLEYEAGDQTLAQVFDELVIPALHRFQPDLILVSAGFDGHFMDPLGPLTLSAQGYAALTRRLRDTAAAICNGRIALLLEGGYNQEALGACVVASLEVLLGRQPRPDALGVYDGPEPDCRAMLNRLRQHPMVR